MAGSGGESAKGWSLWWDGITSSAKILGVSKLSIPTKEGLYVDVTDLDDDVVRDFFHTGLVTLPEFDVSVNSKSTSAQHIAIMNAAGADSDYEFVFKNAAGDALATVDCQVRKHNLEIVSKDAVRGTFTLKMISAPSFTVST